MGEQDDNTTSTGIPQRPKTRLDCPCGTRLIGEDEDDLVVKAQEHLKKKHPGMEYSREEILFMAF